LTFVDRFDIEDQEAGLNEPSGLTLSPGGNALWTVSDDTKKVFQLDLNGELRAAHPIEIPQEGLEGIALDPTGEFLFMVNEDTNEIIKLSIKRSDVIQRRALSEMAGYEEVARHFVNSPPNKGLEGITWNTDTGSIFVIKEGVPGLLLEVSADLSTIQSHIFLTHKNGFVDNDVIGDKLDFSGICYDPSRRRFWIISDKGKRGFLFDRNENKVIRSMSLGYVSDDQYREIRKAEGVAIDSGSNRLFVVSDKEARLYVFDLRELSRK